MNRVKVMKKNGVRYLLPVLLAAVLFMPVQLRLCLAAETVPVVKDVETTETLEAVETVTPVGAEEEDASSLSTPVIIGIGVGAAVLIGVAVAAGGGGSDSDSNSTVPVQTTPPTSDQLVSSWSADAIQPGSGLTYYGTYQLYQGGSLSYDIYISDGEHFAGGGSWSISEYTLTIYTDHGSRYVGDFAPGNINTVTMNSTTGWGLTLTR